MEADLGKTINLTNGMSLGNNDVATILSRWQTIVAELDSLKRFEMELRKDLVEALWQGDRLRGSQTQHLPNGWKLELGRTQNYNVDKAEAPAIYSIFPEVVKPRWEVSASKYEALSPSQRDTLRDFITITDGAPTLKLIGPKD